MIDIVVMYALLASVFSFGKVILSYVPPLFLASITELCGGALLMGYLYTQGQLSKIFEPRYILKLIPIALCITYGAAILRFYALCSLPSFKMCFFSAFDPFIAAFLCYVLRGQKLAWIQLAGIVVATLGSLPMILCNVSPDCQGAATGFISLPVIAAIAAVTINRLGWIFASDILKDGVLNVLQVTASILVIGGGLSLVTSLFYEPNAFMTITQSYTVMGIILYIIIVNNVVCASMYTALLKRYSVTFLSLAEFLTPLFVALYGWLFLHEPVGVPFFVSAGLVALGLGMFASVSLRKNT